MGFFPVGERSEKMSEIGIRFTHFAEFAWGTLEPEEGIYDFEWLDRAVALAGKYGLKVIMCTPSPTPPVWLSKNIRIFLSGGIME